MPIRAPRWVEVSDSQFTHEREGLAYLKEHLPNAAPYRVWTNFEFMDSQGRWHEVDALVLGQGRLHLVELKYYNGSLAGSESTWLRNGRRSERSPLLLARQKAQRLSSRIGDVLKEVARKTNTPIAEVNGWVPWIQECVFLHHPDLDVRLSGIAASNLFSFDSANNALPDIMDRLLEPAGQKQMTDQTGIRLVAALATLGIMRRPTREYGSWLVTDRPLAEGEGWQDFPAEHRQDPEDKVRIRIFPLPLGSAHHQLAEHRRRVNQEHQLLKVLKHDGIVTPRDTMETDEGFPGLVYDVLDGFTPLDLLMAERALTSAQQLAIAERIAEALAYAHRHQVAHRGLNPHAVLVNIPADAAAEPLVRLSDWTWSGRIHQHTSGLTRVSKPALPDLAGAELYEAPEGRWSPDADRQKLDIFSLGAVTYFLVTGAPPAADLAGLRDKLRAGTGGLDLATADAPFVNEDLRQLILQATTPKVAGRLSGSQAFAEQIRRIRQAAEQSPTDDVDPLAAAPDALIGNRFVLQKILGSGSTATGLLVKDTEFDDDLRVLKVALNDDAATRLRAEAEVLKKVGETLGTTSGIVRLLADPFDVEFGPTERLSSGGSRAASERRRRTMLLLSSGGERTLAEQNRFDVWSIPQLKSLGGQLLDIVAALDRAGVLHRDIKPANLGLQKSIGNENTLTLFDFSLASSRVEATEAGTRPYLDPFLRTRERPRYDRPAEWYAAAVVLFEMATQIVPTYGDGLSAPDTITEDVTVPDEFPGIVGNAALTAGLADFFRRALSRDLTIRFASIEDMRDTWRSLFELTAAASAASSNAGAIKNLKGRRPARPVPALTGSGELEPGALRPLSELIKELARTAGGSNSTGRRLVYLLLPTSPGEQDVPPLATQGELAAALNVTPARVNQLLTDLRDKWLGDDDIGQQLGTLLHGLRGELQQSGGVSTPGVLAEALLARFYSSPVDPALSDPRRTITGLLRILLELGARMDDPWEKRRRDGVIATVGLTPLHLDAADAVAAGAAQLVKQAEALGQQLLPGRAALPDLRREAEVLVDPALGSAIPDQVLLRLAAIRPTVVGLSAADELHSGDLPVVQAVAAVLQGLPASTKIRPDNLRSRVSARFPMLQDRLPHRPALDVIVAKARPALTWDPEDQAYVGPQDSAHPSTLTLRQPSRDDLGERRTTATPLAWALGNSPVFRAFHVPAGRSDDLAQALVDQYGGDWIDVTAEIIRLMQQRATAAGVPWETILAADAGTAEDRVGLAAFVEQVWPQVCERVERPTGGPAVLTDLATLAAYGLLGRLSRWTDLTKPPPRTILALVPRSRGGLTVDGEAMHLNSPEQLVPLTEQQVNDIVAANRPQMEERR